MIKNYTFVKQLNESDFDKYDENVFDAFFCIFKNCKPLILRNEQSFEWICQGY